MRDGGVHEKVFLILRSQKHANFFNAEIRGICEVVGVPVPSCCSSSSPDIVLRVNDFDEAQIRRILERSVLIKGAYELIAEGGYHELRESLQSGSEPLKRLDADAKSFAVRSRAVGKKKSRDSAFDYVTRHFSRTPVDLVNPELLLYLIEEYVDPRDEFPSHVFLTRFLGPAQGHLKTKYDLQRRQYIGNTTMDPELSFLQVNIASIEKCSLVFDPFCGTGGLMLAAAEFGAMVLGTEINWKVAKAQGKSSRAGAPDLTDEDSIEANFLQQGIDSRFLGVILGDSSQHEMWRKTPIFDAIVTDPPYGVREKGRKVGLKKRKEHWTLPRREHEVHIAEKVAYHPQRVFADLLDLAARVLIVGGRVSFWIPIIVEEYQKYGLRLLPSHAAFELRGNCEQRLTKGTARRLLLFVKIRESHDDEVADAGFFEGTFRDVLHPGNH